LLRDGGDLLRKAKIGKSRKPVVALDQFRAPAFVLLLFGDEFPHAALGPNS
jgi:hypothetical protein